MPTALIVEDEPEANKLLAMLLQLRGYETISAFRGDEALEKIRENAPDVVFLDLMLPDMNGYDVCRSLKSSGIESLIPVVIVTARLAAENRIQSFEAGADDYIPKPYTPDQVFDALKQSCAWKDELDSPRVEGEVALDLRDDGETLRRLARLRRLVQVRGLLGPDDIDRISAAIRELWSSFDNWSRRRRLDRVATLNYAMTSEALTLIIHDEAGWLAALSDFAPAHLAEAQFDEVIADEENHSLRLVKRFTAR
ncbi:MAG: response regulator transcription factor [Isosphaeraceae bacterium]